MGNKLKAWLSNVIVLRVVWVITLGGLLLGWLLWHPLMYVGVGCFLSWYILALITGVKK